MYTADLIITHILSQILFRWIPLPEATSGLTNKEPFFWSVDHWIDYLQTHLQDEHKSRPWVRFVFSNKITNKAIFLKYLAQQIVEHISYCRQHGAHYILLSDPHFPDELRHIPDPPAAISVIGQLTLLKRPKIAIIGSRYAKRESIAMARELASQLASKGSCVVSGGAIGCDRAAHQGCLDVMGEACSTASVMASGLAQLYPRYNFELFEAITRNGGLLVSERLWQTKARNFDFPIRNRIIAGLSSQILVIEANIKSGSMTTAHLALKYGREVCVYRPQQARGDHLGNMQLIEDGAQFFSTTQDYWEIM